jgi:hypothetical protein
MWSKRTMMNNHNYFHFINTIIKHQVNHFFWASLFSFTVTSFLFVFSKRRGFCPGKKFKQFYFWDE